MRTTFKDELLLNVDQVKTEVLAIVDSIVTSFSDACKHGTNNLNEVVESLRGGNHTNNEMV